MWCVKSEANDINISTYIGFIITLSPDGNITSPVKNAAAVW